MTGTECEVKKAELIAKDDAAHDMADIKNKPIEQAREEGEVSRWYPEDGPHKGKTRWLYACQSEKNFKDWIARSTKCE